MPEIDLDRLEEAAEWLALAFYGLMLMALAAALFGSAGWGFLLLVLGSCAHVGRASFEEFIEGQPVRVERSKRGRRLRAEPVPVRSRGSSRPADDFVVTAPKDRRGVRLGG